MEGYDKDDDDENDDDDKEDDDADDKDDGDYEDMLRIMSMMIRGIIWMMMMITTR